MCRSLLSGLNRVLCVFPGLMAGAIALTLAGCDNSAPDGAAVPPAVDPNAAANAEKMKDFMAKKEADSSKAAEAKKDDAKGDMKKEDAKKDDTKAEDTKKDDTKKDDTKKDDK
jgi:hypothetical protein